MLKLAYYFQWMLFILRVASEHCAAKGKPGISVGHDGSLSPLSFTNKKHQMNRDRRRVEIYRKDQPVEILTSPDQLFGEDVLPGFVLNL
jgi:hypothetical protein